MSGNCQARRCVVVHKDILLYCDLGTFVAAATGLHKAIVGRVDFNYCVEKCITTYVAMVVKFTKPMIALRKWPLVLDSLISI